MRLEIRPTVHMFLDYCDEKKIDPCGLDKPARDDIISAMLREYFKKYPNMRDYGYGGISGGGTML